MSAQAPARGASPFSPRVVLSLLLFGMLAFLATLYFIGMGEPMRDDNDGGGHAAGRGLNGYAGLSSLLEAQGYSVSVARNPSRLEEDSLLILTPPHNANAEELASIISSRRYTGPTLIILPKWHAIRFPRAVEVDSQPGWVALIGASTPEWASDIFDPIELDAKLATSGETVTAGQPAAENASPASEGPTPEREAGWHGLGLQGTLPDGKAVQSLSSGGIVPLVRDEKGQDLVSYLDDVGYYPELADWADIEPNDTGKTDKDLWPVVIVAEPDLMNNYGLADKDRAMLALRIVEAALEDYDLPITFDVTLNGLGQSENLLTLAFTPPFLAATLCLIVAALIVGWRAFGRFGPPMAEQPVTAFGKRQLAVNVASLIQRSGRLYLLGAPYAALMRQRLARTLGLHTTADTAKTEADIDILLERRGLGPTAFSQAAERLRAARGAHELLRQAHALKLIERKLDA